MTKKLGRMRTAAGTVVSRLAGRGTGRVARPHVVFRPQPLQRWDP